MTMPDSSSTPESAEITFTSVPPPMAACDWEPDEECFGQDYGTLNETQRQFALSLASATLRHLSGYRVGGCPITVRPNPGRGQCFVPYVGVPSSLSPGVDSAGRWVNGCGHSSSYDPRVITLPGPVGTIYEVRIDGVEVDPENYRHQGRSLVWQGDPSSGWPRTQDVHLADTEPGTFSVTYRNSYEPDSAGRCVVAILAGEFGKAISGKGKCRLPSNVTSLTRQGISMDFITGVFADGRTGIREVDAWISLWNPQNLRQQSKVWYPGVAQTP
jgi:hypothetical protein